MALFLLTLALIIGPTTALNIAEHLGDDNANPRQLQYIEEQWQALNLERYQATQPSGSPSQIDSALTDGKNCQVHDVCSYAATLAHPCDPKNHKSLPYP